MSRDVPQIEPTEIQAGDTLEWARHFEDFPAPTWALTYYIKGSGALQQGLPAIDPIVAVASGTDFSVTVSAAITGAYAAGDYWLIGFVSSGLERFEVYRAKIKVSPDLATSDPYDGRTYYERILDKLRKVIEEGVIRDVFRYSWNGMNVEVVTMEDALKAEGMILAKIAQENGTTKQRKILTRFVGPR